MNEFKDQLIAWRHRLHQNPELAFEEHETAAFVADELRKMGIEVAEGIGGTGVVGTLRCGSGERVIAFRADMDCIALQETGTCGYRSKNEGRMHACGHDGHTTSLLGAAKLLSDSRDFNGSVRFVFQPAEEPGTGADAMIADGFLERFPIDEFYGFHNQPMYPAGTIHMKAGGAMASEDNFTIVIKGEGGHASSPHLGKDPLVIASEIILALQTVVSRNSNPVLPAVISCTEIETDGAHNAIPSTVTIKGDTRSTDPETQQLIENRMREICEGMCKLNGAECEFTYTHEFVPLVNDAECAAAAAAAALKVFGEGNVDGSCQPWMASEDFAKFLAKVPGCYAFLGSGKTGDNPPVHNSRFDYNDDVLEPGARFFEAIAHDRLK